MGINAVVYCDDVEKGRLRIPHPLPHLLFIDETGCPNISSDNPQDIYLHDQWEGKSPCPHKHFWLVERWLGNASLIDRIRELVERVAEEPLLEYPILWSKVIYNGLHSGDFLRIEEVSHLDNELNRLRKVESISGDDQILFNDFLSKLEDLVRASLSVKKPITF